MNILDENVREDQRSLLQAWGIPVQQIGSDIGRKGQNPVRGLHRRSLEGDCPI
jgi:hypothetical protein